MKIHSFASIEASGDLLFINNQCYEETGGEIDDRDFFSALFCSKLKTLLLFSIVRGVKKTDFG